MAKNKPCEGNARVCPHEPSCKKFDIHVINHGSIVLLQPATKAGAEWLDENIDPDAQTWVNAIVCEPRYVGDIVRGAIRGGLRIL